MRSARLFVSDLASRVLFLVVLLVTLTSDPRFVMLKPSVVYCIVGAYMLKPGWMNRYLPPIAVQTVPDIA
jgi:intracellular septation protein